MRYLFALAGLFCFVAAGCEVTVESTDGGIIGADPALPGPCANVASAPRELIDRSGRNLFVTVYLPRLDSSGPCSATQHPLVLLAPDSQQDPRQYQSYAEHLASHGLAALIVDYPDDPFTADHRELTRDLRAVLDWAEGAAGDLVGPYRGRFDSTRSAAVGHGVGAAIALLASFDDPRLLAVAALDPVDGNPFSSTFDPRYPSLVPQRAAELTKPLLLLGETTNSVCSGEGCRPCVPLGDNYQRFFDAAAGPALEVTFIGANHNMWLDEPACGFLCDACSGGTADAARVRLLSRRYVAAFLRWQLLADAGGVPYLCASGQDPLPGEATLVSCRSNEQVQLDAGVADGAVSDGGPADSNADGGLVDAPQAD